MVPKQYFVNELFSFSIKNIQVRSIQNKQMIKHFLRNILEHSRDIANTLINKNTFLGSFNQVVAIYSTQRQRLVFASEVAKHRLDAKYEVNK